MARPAKYPPELRQRTVRLVIESRAEHETEFAAIKSVAAKLGIAAPGTLRKWLRQAEIDQGVRSGVTSRESAELKRLKRENAELRRANEILKAVWAFFVAELDRPGRASSTKVLGPGRDCHSGGLRGPTQLVLRSSPSSWLSSARHQSSMRPLAQHPLTRHESSRHGSA